MRCATVVSPRGVAFHPQLVEGSFAECKDLVEGALREILDSFQAPGMPARVLPGVDHRSPMEVEGHQGIKDDRGDKCGHAFSQPHCWWAQLVLYLTESGGHCAAMEEHLIAIFKRHARGLRG